MLSVFLGNLLLKFSDGKARFRWTILLDKHIFVSNWDLGLDLADEGVLDVSKVVDRQHFLVV